MPSFKKRVHSQRVPQHERAAVTPYEGSYDEKYSSDEENIEYEVCEPEDLTERSNSTVTFSEDVYDSDAVDEMIKSQIRKSSHLSQDSPIKDENVTDGSLLTKSILKDEKSKSGKKDSPNLNSPDAQPLPQLSKNAKKPVSSQEILHEGTVSEMSSKPSAAATSEAIKKDEKGEELIEDVTRLPKDITDKETSMKGERDIVTKSLQSTLPLQTDHITDSSATNKHDFAASDETFLIKPLQDSVLKGKDILMEAVPSEEFTLSHTDNLINKSKSTHEKNADSSPMKKPSKDAEPAISPADIKPDAKKIFATEQEFNAQQEQFSDATAKPTKDDVEQANLAQSKPSQKVGEIVETLVSPAELLKEKTTAQIISPTREEAARTAMELIDDITKSVQDVFPELTSKERRDKVEDALEESFKYAGHAVKSTVFPTDKKAQNGGTKQLEGTVLIDQTVSPSRVSEIGKKSTDSEYVIEKPEIPIEKKNGVLPDVSVTDKLSETFREVLDIQKPLLKELGKSSKNSEAEILVGKEKTLDEHLEKNETEKISKGFDGQNVKTSNGVIKSEKEASASDKSDLSAIIVPVSETVTNITGNLTQSSFTDSNIQSGLAEEMNFRTVQDIKKSEAVTTSEIIKDKSKPLDILMVASTDSSSIKTNTELSSVSDVKTDLGKSSELTSEKPDELMSGISTSADDKDVKGTETQEGDTKPRVIFRIDSEDELLSDADNDLLPHSNVSSPTEKLTDKLKQEIKESLEKDKLELEEKLTSLKGGIFDISEKSLSKTKEIVDERLRKISDIKPPQELEEPAKKEKSPARTDAIKIGRFHITPTLVEEVIRRTKEHDIVEKLKTARTVDEARDEVEKELPEKLTEADLEEVIRELKKEGLKTDVYLQSEDPDKEDKKDRTLKRVERRFERMASETLEKDKEDGVSEEKLNERREIEFQQMLSNLSNEEVAEYQQEYLQLCEEGGLSSLTPTEDWESRDPDTPENELDDDSPKKSESFRGSYGVGETGEPKKSSEPKNSLKSPITPPKPLRVSDEVPKAQPLTPIDASHVGSSPSDVDPTSGFVSERSDDIPTYGERRKFWEQMSSSYSSETANDLPRGSVSSVESIETEKVKDTEDHDRRSGKKKIDKQVPDSSKQPEENGLVKSLTESYSKKIAAGELIMPAVPRPRSPSKGSPEFKQTETEKLPDSSDIAVVSELELMLKSRRSSAPITEKAVVSGSTELIQQKLESSQHSTDNEDALLPISELKKIFQPPPVAQVRKSIQERSMSLPVAELLISAKGKAKNIRDEIKKDIIVEQITSQEEPIADQTEEKTTERKITPDIEETATSAMTELLSKSVKIAEQALRNQEKVVVKESGVIKTVETLKESHEEKSETEGNEKETVVEHTKPKLKENEGVPSITVTTTGKRHVETASIGESEDTQSESDFTPEEARIMDNGDAHWDGSGTQSGGFSPKDDIDYSKELGETGIGRWIGQEDLSKQIWDKDDLDSSHFKIQTKWERTRSEGASPKEHYVCTPEEHYPDTVWEVPVQEQLEKEEITHEIPIEKQVIIEKDEEEYEEEDETKIKLTEEEAKEIAEEILEYIQFEVENRSSFLVNDAEETPEGITQAQVTDYLRHLTGGKEFDNQDVQLIESILAKKQKTPFWKSQSADTAGCSVDITDEELRTSDNDISPVESQITKLQSLEEEEFFEITTEKPETKDEALKKAVDDINIVDQTIAEVKESLEAAQEQLLEQHKKETQSELLEKDSPSEFEFRGMSQERKISEPTEEQPSRWEKMKSCEIIDESESILIVKESEGEAKSEDRQKIEDKVKIEKKSIESERLSNLAETDIIKFGKTESTVQEDDKSKEIETDETLTGQDLISSSSKTEIQKLSKIQKPTISEIKMESEVKNLEISVPETMVIRKLGEQIYSTEDSPRSTSLEESRGEEVLSSSSSVEKPEDIKPDVVFRHSGSAFLKADRRSGTDLEPYSSSGESHCHSFEQTPSRPCSSDVEGLLAGNIVTTGSSEYESAISHEISSKQPTSTDYQTAVSSLSSRESIKSLDSESSGHLASVEVSSEASETLIPSALELDKDTEVPGTMPLDNDGLDFEQSRKPGQPAMYKTQVSAPAGMSRPADEDFEIISEMEVASWTGDVSEDEEAVVTGEEAISSEEHAQKMKRSHEMTFQPEPKPIVFSESIEGLSKDSVTEKGSLGLSIDENLSIISAPDEKFGSSLEESGSVLSMSLSTTSETSGMRTVIEMSHTDSEKIDGSLSASVSSTHSALREDWDTPTTPQPQVLTNEMSTSTATSDLKKKTESVTITTSSSDVQGVPCVSTQVTSISRKSSMADDSKSESESLDLKPLDLSHANGPTQVEYVADYDEVETTKSKKFQGHRRKESTSSFVPTMMWNLGEAKTQNVKSNISEEDYGSDKYVHDVTLTEKEVKNDEKKEADDSEEKEKKFSEGEEMEEFKDPDYNRSQRTGSDNEQKPISPVFSEDRPDSELSELMKQGSSETEKEDPLERPASPEPEEMENKDITPEFSSEAQASVTELEMEYSGAYSRRDEYASHVSPIREERSDARFKETSEEYPEIEKVSDGLRSQTSLESTVAEKHELESGEKENLQDKIKEKRLSDVPDITITEHMTPVSHQKFQYPEPKEEIKEKKSSSKTPDTPASTSSRTSSSSTDQGREYNLDEAEIKKLSKEVLSEEKEVNETKEEKESVDSPSSDSFEMLDKPDINDEFVIIDEVGREAEENDREGKSIQIAAKKKKPPKQMKEEQDVVLSPPAPATKMTDLKYYPSEDDSELFSFDSNSPPQPATRKFVEKLKRKSSKEEKDELEYEQQIEQNKKWLETQFQGEEAAKIMGVYGYEMEFERAPLEDIKEEDLNELDSSSKIGSMGSQKESIGSFGSVKDSFSSTPDYDVLAGRKYFTRSGDHDDVSMSSLQEFELIEKKLMENGKKSGSSSSQDSLSSKRLGTSSKSGQDDVSSGSLKEFETLENACTTVVNMEKKAKQEEAILSEIDEGHESQISESESCETVSAVMREKVEFDTEDFDKKMFEIDEIIRQAQSNVEKFSEMQALEKIETIGRGDSYEEVAKVPDLELDMPLSEKSIETSASKYTKSTTPYSTQVVTKKKVEEWRAAEKTEQRKTGTTLDKKSKQEPTKRSELLENGGKIKSVSADSLEIQTAEKQIIPEGKEDTISLDSYRRKPQKSNGYELSKLSHKSDSMEEVSSSLKHHETSSGDYTFSGTDHVYRLPPRADFILGSTDSLDPSSSTATHATYQYETDSVMSSSFTSGDSNTMVSSTDNLDLLVSGQSVVDLTGISKTDDWLENLEVGGANPLKPEIQKVSFMGAGAAKALQEYLENVPQEEIVETEEVDEHGNIHVKKILKQRVVIPSDSIKTEKTQFVSETVEPLMDGTHSHIIHRRVQMSPEIQKVVFKGPDAEKALQSYIEQLNTEEEVQEIEEVDERGNIHVKKVIRQKVVIKPETSSESLRELRETHVEVPKSSFKPQDSHKSCNTKGRVIESEEAEKDGTVSIEHEQLEEIKKKSAQLEVIEMGPQVQKVIFKGPNAEEALKEYTESLNPEDDVIEVEEVDEHGNVHIKKILRQKIIVRPNQDLTEDELHQYLTQLAQSGSLEGENYSHVVQKTFDVPTNIQKVTFRGPDAEKQLQQFLQQQQPEIEEIEETDEYGNVHIKKILRQKVVVRPERELTKQELEQYLQQLEKSENENSSQEKTTEVQKIVFKGPDAEKQLQEFLQQQQPEIEEIEETDEYGNVHIKKILRQKVVVRPDRELTKQELEKYIQIGKFAPSGGIATSRVHTSVELPSEVQKIVFKGPDAERQLQEFLQQQQLEPEIDEIEETDEDGNVHIKKVLRQKVVVRPERELTQEELEKYVKSGEFRLDVDIATSHMIHSRAELPSEVQKITFKGPDAEKQLQEFLQQQQLEPEIEEIEETDEDGNVHIKKILRQKVVIRPNRKLTKEELEKYIKSGEVTPSEGDTSHAVHSRVELPLEMHKITFEGPDADKQLQAFMQQQQPEIEEIEETDEHGNVHIKRIVKQKVFIRPEELETYQYGHLTGAGDEFKSSRILTKDELEQYLENLEKPESYSKEEEGPRFGLHPNLKEPFELTHRLLTEEEFQERLNQMQSESTSKFVPSDEKFSRVIHKRVTKAPEVEKVVFSGPNADQAMKEYLQALSLGDEVEETKEVDADGNLVEKKIIKRKTVLRPEDLKKAGLTGEELESYLRGFHLYGERSSHVQAPDPNIPLNLLTEGFSSAVVLTEKEGRSEEEKQEEEASATVRKESGISQRPPLVSDISMDDEAEYDTTEHDWRHQLEILHAETDEVEIEESLDAALAASHSSLKEK